MLPLHAPDPTADLRAGEPVAGWLQADDGTLLPVTVHLARPPGGVAPAPGPAPGPWHPSAPAPAPAAAAPAPAPPASTPAPTPAPTPGGLSPEDADAAFRLQLEMDVVHEQLVLYRVVLVLEALGALLLLRQWLLS